MADGSIQSLRERIDETIAGGGEAILNRVHAQYVEAEEKRRSDIIVAGINLLRTMEADRKKIDRPDQILYGEDGQPAQSLFTKGRIDELKKNRDRLNKLQSLLDKVVQTNVPEDYKKLEDAIKKGGKSDDKPGVEEE